VEPRSSDSDDSSAGRVSGHDLVGELAPLLFASLRRSDQRTAGEQYVRGLLSAAGRKTMRNIADVFGGGAVQQRMQHFISASTWDWDPVRHALGGHLAAALRPQAWVVRPMIVPKAGAHSVGVERRFVNGLGRTLNSQQAFGAWYASQSASAPVNWNLFLSEAWLKDDARGREAGIPEGDRQRPPAFPGESACRAVPRSADHGPGPGGSRLPVVVSAGRLDTAACIRHFAARGIPVVLRISGDERVRSRDGYTAAPYGGTELPARDLAESLGSHRRPVEWIAPGGRTRDPLIRRSWVAAVRVRLAGVPDADPLLLAESPSPGRHPGNLWLTDVADRSPADLLRLTKLVLRVDHDLAQVSSRVGILDFEGRSFQGWHRHTTLVSVAHTVRVLCPAATGRTVYERVVLPRAAESAPHDTAARSGARSPTVGELT
jgi:syndecan 1